jgi:hypothetical protein
MTRWHRFMVSAAVFLLAASALMMGLALYFGLWITVITMAMTMATGFLIYTANRFFA